MLYFLFVRNITTENQITDFPALLTLLVPGGVFRTPSNFAAFGAPLIVKYIEMFHADFSYLSIY